MKKLWEWLLENVLTVECAYSDDRWFCPTLWQGFYTPFWKLKCKTHRVAYVPLQILFATELILLSVSILCAL